MLVTFTTKAHANIMMFGDVAIKLLKMMGHSGTIPSALLAEDVPAALEQLTKALTAQADIPNNDEAEEGQPPVSLHNRAVPLIELLNDAIKHNADVMWE